MGRFQNSIALAKASLRVLRDDKQLTVLPLLSGIATLVVAASFFIPAALVAHDGATGGFSMQPLDWVLTFAGYLALTFVVVFFNAALVYAADRHLHGEDVTIGQAISAAASRSRILLPWVLVSATVSLLLRAVEQRAGVVGRIVAAFAGVAWSVVTFLVLPILVVEGIGPIAAVKRSGELFKKTWGENLIANAGIGIVTFLVGIVGLIPIGLLFLVGGPVAVVAAGLAIAWLIAVSLVSATLTGILQTALYRFATGEQVPGFPEAELRGTFRVRGAQGPRGIIG